MEFWYYDIFPVSDPPPPGYRPARSARELAEFLLNKRSGFGISVYSAAGMTPESREHANRILVNPALRDDDLVEYNASAGVPLRVVPVNGGKPGKPEARPEWDEYFMRLAHLAATRATCDRKHVGAVIVRDRRVMATGYNGSPPGLPHCDDVGHDLVETTDGKQNCVRTVHAEMNALLQAAATGAAVKGSTVYTNTYPCWNCAKAILGAGITAVVTDADYNNDPRVEAAFKAAGVRVYTVKVPT